MQTLALERKPSENDYAIHVLTFFYGRIVFFRLARLCEIMTWIKNLVIQIPTQTRGQTFINNKLKFALVNTSWQGLGIHVERQAMATPLNKQLS